MAIFSYIRQVNFSGFRIYQKKCSRTFYNILSYKATGTLFIASVDPAQYSRADSFGAKTLNNTSNLLSDMDLQWETPAFHGARIPFTLNVVSDIPLSGFTMQHAEPLEL